MKLEMVNRKHSSSASHTHSWNICPKWVSLLRFEKNTNIFLLSFLSQLLIFTWWWRSEFPLLFLMIVVLERMKAKATIVRVALVESPCTFWFNKIIVWEMLFWTEAEWMLNRHKVMCFGMEIDLSLNLLVSSSKGINWTLYLLYVIIQFCLY